MAADGLAISNREENTTVKLDFDESVQESLGQQNLPKNNYNDAKGTILLFIQ